VVPGWEKGLVLVLALEQARVPEVLPALVPMLGLELEPELPLALVLLHQHNRLAMR